ncbi:hypothetical protein NEHOM01_1516 [Nematocida homosporus]|uniref:uncharacterized protein n=1 Tax=Nematocida homosporus TaxID=1912981 RepID=UPI002221222E|nr:uncharacterized protein NEHOM01_1516 [Nematocida homosporus]KAI5186516.1 hypothetical protein NEHOM01_1516 [Nematocida homosporus]
MYSQPPKSIISRIVVLLAALAAFIIKCKAATLADDDSKLTASLPTLEDLAHLDFAWAKQVLHEHNNDNDTSDTDTSDTNTTDNEEFIKQGFYELLEFNPCNLNRVIRAASLLKPLLSPLNSYYRIPFPSIQSVSDVLMLYTALNQLPRSNQPTTQSEINKKHIGFLENLSWWISTNSTSISFVNELELLCLDPAVYTELTNKTPEQNEESLPLLEHKYLKLNDIRASPLIKYIHPVNRQLYSQKLTYRYNKEKKELDVVSWDWNNIHDHNTLLISSFTECTFEDAVRLRHFSNDDFFITASSRDFNLFTSAMATCPGMPSQPMFRQTKDRAIDRFKDYEGTKQHTQDSMTPEEVEMFMKSEQREKARGSIGKLLWGVLADLQLAAIIFQVLFSSHAMIVYLIPINILILAFVIAIALAGWPEPLQGRRRDRSWQYKLFSFLVGLSFLFLLAFFIVQTMVYFKNDGVNLFDMAILAVLLFAPLITISCTTVRGAINHRWPSITRRLHWVLYTMSFLMVATIPIFARFISTYDARMLLDGHILLVSSIVFGVGLLLHAFGYWLDEGLKDDGAKRTTGTILAHILKLTIISLIMGGLFGLSIWAIYHYELLADPITEIKNYNPSGSLKMASSL